LGSAKSGGITEAPAYENLAKWKGGSERDLLAAHKQLMRGLLDHPGAYRVGERLKFGPLFGMIEAD